MLSSQDRLVDSVSRSERPVNLIGRCGSLLSNLELESELYHKLCKETGIFVTCFSSKIDLGTFLTLK